MSWRYWILSFHIFCFYCFYSFQLWFSTFDSSSGFYCQWFWYHHVQYAWKFDYISSKEISPCVWTQSDCQHCSNRWKKNMNTPVQLSMHEILIVFTEISSYLHDQTRKRDLQCLVTGSCFSSMIHASTTWNAQIEHNSSSESTVHALLSRRTSTEHDCDLL